MHLPQLDIALKRLRSKVRFFLRPHGKVVDPAVITDIYRHRKCSVGAWTYGQPTVFSWKTDDRLVIGRFCSIANDVTILLGGEHFADGISTYPASLFRTRAPSPELDSFSKGPVVIGSDVWIGHGATILSGVRIGSGAIIGARAVVARSVDPFAVVIGNPAKELRRRYSDDRIRQLLDIAWWDWPDDKIWRHRLDIWGTSIDLFLERHGPHEHSADALQ